MKIMQLPTNNKIHELVKEGNQMTIAKDLQILVKEIQALEKKMVKLADAIEKSEKTKASKKAPAKTAKIGPAKKAFAKKRIAKLTATDQVLKIINRSKKGINATTLMNKTGFDNKKIQNILHRTYKQGKIKRAAKGIYVGA